MDVLKRELQRKRRLIDADFGVRKLLPSAEIEAREIQRLRFAERQLLLQKQQLRSHPAASPSASSPASANAAEAQADHQGDARDALQREEVIRRLRLLRQPATLFGEDDAARLRRLHSVLDDCLTDIDSNWQLVSDYIH